jgi:hypothetical protein
LPHHELYDTEREKIRRVEIGICRYVEIRERVRESSSAAPGHGEHDMQWYGQCLSAMNVAHARRIRNDGFGNERRSCKLIKLDTWLPTAFQHFTEHLSFAADVSGLDTGKARDYSWVLDDVCHELSRISAYRVELQARWSDEVFKGSVSGETDSVAISSLQSSS